MGPIQMMRLFLGAGRYRRAGIVQIGVLPEYRGRGVAQALAATLYRYYQDKGLKSAFYHLVNEENTASRRFAESIGGAGRVLYHVYDRHLY
jgi:ribosomal protein S18 acetylase RimI-like enzyme